MVQAINANRVTENEPYKRKDSVGRNCKNLDIIVKQEWPSCEKKVIDVVREYGLHPIDKRKFLHNNYGRFLSIDNNMILLKN